MVVPVLSRVSHCALQGCHAGVVSQGQRNHTVHGCSYTSLTWPLQSFPCPDQQIHLLVWLSLAVGRQRSADAPRGLHDESQSPSTRRLHGRRPIISSEPIHRRHPPRRVVAIHPLPISLEIAGEQAAHVRDGFRSGLVPRSDLSRYSVGVRSMPCAEPVRGHPAGARVLIQHSVARRSPTYPLPVTEVLTRHIAGVHMHDRLRVLPQWRSAVVVRFARPGGVGAYTGGLTGGGVRGSPPLGFAGRFVAGGASAALSCPVRLLPRVRRTVVGVLWVEGAGARA